MAIKAAVSAAAALHLLLPPPPAQRLSNAWLPRASARGHTYTCAPTPSITVTVTVTRYMLQFFSIPHSLEGKF
jgi:hypothetical protein